MDGLNVTRLDETKKGMSMDQAGKRSMGGSQGYPNPQRSARGPGGVRRIPGTGHPERQAENLSLGKGEDDAVTGQGGEVTVGHGDLGGA